MKIGIDARGALWYRGSGIGTYAYQLIRNLHNMDESNEYILFYPQDEHISSMPSHQWVWDNHIEKKPRFWELVNESISEIPQDLSIFHIPHNGVGLPDKPRGCRMVVTIHDLIPYVLPQACGKEYRNIVIREMPRIVENSDILITVSYHSKNDIINFFDVPEEKIIVTHEAAEDIYRPVERDQARWFVEEKYGIKGRYILNIGGFSIRKNIRCLIKAFYEVHRDLPSDYQLVIVGKPGGGSYSRCLELVEQLGIRERVIFTGFVPMRDMPYLYNAADLFVYPSIYEGFGLPVLEAMACGVPTIAGNNSSIPEVAGDSAILVDTYFPDKLAEAIHRVIHNPEVAANLVGSGIKRASSFSWAKTAKETLLVYESIASYW